MYTNDIFHHEHHHHINQVMQKLRENQLYLKLEKIFTGNPFPSPDAKYLFEEIIDHQSLEYLQHVRQKGLIPYRLQPFPLQSYL